MSLNRWPLVVVLVALAIAPAFAADKAPMPTQRAVNLDTPLLDAAGKPVKDPSGATKDDPTCAKCAPLMIRSVIANCLVGEQKPGQGAALWALAMRVVSSKEITLDGTELHAIEACLDNKPAIISGQIIAVIDPALAGKQKLQ